MRKVTAPMQSVVVRFAVAKGEVVKKGQSLVILEAMKMEHVVSADRAGVVRSISSEEGATVAKGDVLLRLEEAAAQEETAPAETEVDALARDHGA